MDLGECHMECTLCSPWIPMVMFHQFQEMGLLFLLLSCFIHMIIIWVLPLNNWNLGHLDLYSLEGHRKDDSMMVLQDWMMDAIMNKSITLTKPTHLLDTHRRINLHRLSNTKDHLHNEVISWKKKIFHHCPFEISLAEEDLIASTWETTLTAVVLITRHSWLLLHNGLVEVPHICFSVEIF